MVTHEFPSSRAAEASGATSPGRRGGIRRRPREERPSEAPAPRAPGRRP